MIMANEILLPSVAFRNSSSVTNETDKRFRKFSQKFPKIEFDISLLIYWSNLVDVSFRF